MDYCIQLARRAAYAEYLCVCMAPPTLRARMIALLALECELAEIALKVREELLAHMRFAWWRERLESGRGGHPVLEAVAQEDKALLMRMVEAHQAAWPGRALPSAAYVAACGGMMEAAGKGERWRRVRKVTARKAGRIAMLLKLLIY